MISKYTGFKKIVVVIFSDVLALSQRKKIVAFYLRRNTFIFMYQLLVL